MGTRKDMMSNHFMKSCMAMAYSPLYLPIDLFNMHLLNGLYVPVMCKTET